MTVARGRGLEGSAHPEKKTLAALNRKEDQSSMIGSMSKIDWKRKESWIAP